MESRFVGLVVLGILKAIAKTYAALPSAGRRAVCIALGRLLYWGKMRRHVVDQNLLFAFPGDSKEAQAKRQHVLVESYVHLAGLVFEIMMLLGPMPQFLRSYVSFAGLENWKEAKKQGKGVIFLSGHVGNWEIMTEGGGHILGMDILAVTKVLRPSWLHTAIEQGRQRCQIQATYEPKTMRDILRHLSKNGTLGMVLDQYAGPPVGVRVPVFGIPVSTTTAFAALVKRTGAVVLPVTNWRDENGFFHVRIGSALPWISCEESTHEELAINTARYAATVEGFIREHPEQWLWTHRRFKGDLSPLAPDEWKKPRSRS